MCHIDTAGSDQGSQLGLTMAQIWPTWAVFWHQRTKCEPAHTVHGCQIQLGFEEAVVG